MPGSSLSRTWTLSVNVRVITAKGLNVVTGCLGPHCHGPSHHCQWPSHHSQVSGHCDWMSGSSLSRAWTLCLDVRVTNVKRPNVVSGCQGHHCQGPEPCVWRSGSSLSRAWTLCLDVRVITVKGLNVVTGCQGHHCQGHGRCLRMSRNFLLFSSKNISLYKMMNLNGHEKNLIPEALADQSERN